MQIHRVYITTHTAARIIERTGSSQSSYEEIIHKFLDELFVTQIGVGTREEVYVPISIDNKRVLAILQKVKRMEIYVPTVLTEEMFTKKDWSKFREKGLEWYYPLTLIPRRPENFQSKAGCKETEIHISFEDFLAMLKNYTKKYEHFVTLSTEATCSPLFDI